MKRGKLLPLAICAAASALLVFQAPASAAPETYEIDPVHSSIGFKIKHLFSFVTGRFDTVKGIVVLDPERPGSSTVRVSIGAASINTSNAKRDAHLKTPDFFDVEKYPALTFVSKSVKQTGKDTADVIGDLTIHGVTKEVPLKVQFLGKGPGPQGEIRGGFEATTTLKRSEFGLTWNKLIEGTALVGDEVTVNLEVEAIQKPAEAPKP